MPTSRVIDKIVHRLSNLYGDAATELEHTSAFELLVATILSAQCTDARVNAVTATLFKKRRTPAEFAKGTLKSSPRCDACVLRDVCPFPQVSREI